MDLIEQIGPFLGIAAFLGLSILAFLLFQQSRDLRRLREWAGRAPERAREASEASQAAAEAREEAPETADEPGGRLEGVRRWLDGLRGRVAGGWAAIDRRLPFDARIAAAVLVAAIVAAGVLTSGFGLFGDEAEQGDGSRAPLPKPRNVDVAVLNATQTADVSAVPGLAAAVSNEVVRPLHYNVVVEGDAPAGVEDTMVAFAPGQRPSASRLANQVRRELGRPDLGPMKADVRETSRRADLALLIGVDNEDFGQ